MARQQAAHKRLLKPDSRAKTLDDCFAGKPGQQLLEHEGDARLRSLSAREKCLELVDGEEAVFPRLHLIRIR